MADLLALVVTLDHGEFFGHVGSEVVVDSIISAMIIARQIWLASYEIYAICETKRLDPFFDPVGEVSAYFQELM